MVADSERPCGAAPVRSVNTPTTDGRRFGSANPLRSGCPTVGPDVKFSPTNVANVPASDDVISMLEHPGAVPVPATRARGTLEITTLRSVTSTRVLRTLT